VSAVEALLRLDRDGAFVDQRVALFVEGFESIERCFFPFFPAVKLRAEVFRQVSAHDRFAI
jgi:hypothetical protein